MNVVELLRSALGELKKDGWTQHNYHDGEGRHCALGALRDVLTDVSGGDEFAFYGNKVYHKAEHLLDSVAYDMSDQKYGSIIDLNDDAKTTFDTVRDAFTMAIRRAKEEGV